MKIEMLKCRQAGCDSFPCSGGWSVLHSWRVLVDEMEVLVSVTGRH